MRLYAGNIFNRSFIMGKVIDFYRKAEADEKLRADLEAANRRFDGQKNINRDTVVAEVIKIATRHGTSLEAADFAAEPGELDEAELEAAAGGTVSVCVTPGQNSPGSGGNGGSWTNDPFRPPYGSNPNPTIGLTIKIS
jgi:hypothetical protein